MVSWHIFLPSFDRSTTLLKVECTFLFFSSVKSAAIIDLIATDGVLVRITPTVESRMLRKRNEQGGVIYFPLR